MKSRKSERPAYVQRATWPLTAVEGYWLGARERMLRGGEGGRGEGWKQVMKAEWNERELRDGM